MILQNYPLFSSCSEEEITAFLTRWRISPTSYRQSERILKEGEPAEYFGLILTGRVSVEKYDLYGNRNVFATLGSGELFGEAFAFSDAQIMTVDVRAAEDTELLLIRHDILLTEAKLVRNMLHLCAQKMFLFDQRIEVISQKKTRDRLLFFLNQQKGLCDSSTFTIPYNRQELAEYLGVDRSGLSVEIHKLVREGVLETKGSWFALKLQV